MQRLRLPCCCCRLAHRRTFGLTGARISLGGGGGAKSYTPWPPPPPIQPFSITKTNPKQQPPGALKFCKHIHVASLMLGSGDGVARAYPRGAPDTIHAGS
eukprot:jgi/Botrbrau1/359/Bobra.110_2s0017.1